MPTRFIVAGLQRSGTTVTYQAVKGHPQVSCPSDEVYVSPFFTRGLATFTGGGELFDERRDGFRALFDTIAGINATAASIAMGLKVAINSHSDAVSFCNSLREYFQDVKIVLVQREDLVAQCGSLQLAEQTGRWHAWKGDPTRPPTKIMVDQKHFESYAALCRRVTCQLRMLKETHDVFEINYETDIAPGTTYAAMFGFLGLNVVKPTWLSMKKVAPQPEEFIENYHKLCRVLESLPEASIDEERAACRQHLAEQASQENPYFLLGRAWDRLEQSRLEDAHADLTTALKSDRAVDFDANSRGRMFAILEEAGADDASTPAKLDDIAKGYGDQPKFLLHRAKARLGRGRAHDAHQDLLQLLQLEGVEEIVMKQVPALVDWAWGQMEDLAAARGALELVETRVGVNPRVRLLRASVLLAEGRAAEGSDEVVTALANSRRPEFEDRAFGLLHQSWMQQCDLGAAESALARLAPSYQSSPFFRLRRAWIHLERGRHRDAHADILFALQCGRHDAKLERWAFEMLEQAWRHLGDASLANESLDRLAETHGDSADLALLRSVVESH